MLFSVSSFLKALKTMKRKTAIKNKKGNNLYNKISNEDILPVDIISRKSIPAGKNTNKEIVP